MRRLAVVAATAVAASVAAGAVGAQSTRVPALRIVSRAPVTLRGRGFQPREVVTVLLRIRRRSRTRTLAASGLGSFRVRFRRVLMRRCTRATVVAVGSMGSAVRLAIPPLRTCHPVRA